MTDLFFFVKNKFNRCQLIQQRARVEYLAFHLFNGNNQTLHSISCKINHKLKMYVLQIEDDI